MTLVYYFLNKGILVFIMDINDDHYIGTILSDDYFYSCHDLVTQTLLIPPLTKCPHALTPLIDSFIAQLGHCHLINNNDTELQVLHKIASILIDSAFHCGLDSQEGITLQLYCYETGITLMTQSLLSHHYLTLFSDTIASMNEKSKIELDQYYLDILLSVTDHHTDFRLDLILLVLHYHISLGVKIFNANHISESYPVHVQSHLTYSTLRSLTQQSHP